MEPKIVEYALIIFLFKNIVHRMTTLEKIMKLVGYLKNYDL